ncbi:MAG: hypothetical protein VKK98_09625 [Cyanobacteriota bacterium]|nr:hypothetical protein [Cyanobacteriota bacterium]
MISVARAADLCLTPWRHAVRFKGGNPTTEVGDDEQRAAVESRDCELLIEARDAEGIRAPEQDFVLEIYRSGEDLNLMLSSVLDESSPLLWHGNHPVWMKADNGERCQRPPQGERLEAFCRRLRAGVIS